VVADHQGCEPQGGMKRQNVFDPNGVLTAHPTPNGSRRAALPRSSP
jgi:hypothetical protein